MKSAYRMTRVLLVLAFPVATHAAEPQGDLIELHSCQLYTGGCTASSEATLGGRSLVRFWNIESGTHLGTNLGGIQVAVIQTADANLAFQDTLPTTTSVYFAPETSESTVEAVVAWLAQSDPTLSRSGIEIRRERLVFKRIRDSVLLRVGSVAHLEATALANCETGACGQQLWYTPRSRVAAFKVIAYRKASVNAESLKLSWSDHGKPSVFLARFGESVNLARVKLAGTEVCAPDFTPKLGSSEKEI
jgi:hypothetical protein